MLDYTIVAGQKVWQSIKRISLVFNIATQLVAMLVLVYIIAAGTGFLPLNGALLAISAAYFIFYCITVREKEKKELKRRVKLFFKWSKRGIKLINLGVMIYALATAKNPTAIDIVLVCFSLGCWALDIVFEIAAIVVKGWGQLMFEAVKADVEVTLAPFTATKNFLRGLTGKEEEAPPPPTERRILLDRLVAERKAELAKKKEAQKIELSQLKQAAKIAKSELKQVEKAEKKASKLAKKRAKKGEPIAEVLEETAISEE